MPDAIPDPDMFRNAINPSFREQAVMDRCRRRFAGHRAVSASLPGRRPRPCPEAISADDVGMLVVNYRNEPVGLRVFDPDKLGPDGKPGTQAGGLNELGVNVNPDAGDLAFALQSRADRAIPAEHGHPVWGTRLYPPLSRRHRQRRPLHADDARFMPGTWCGSRSRPAATEHEHNATIHGVKWLQGGSGHGAAPNSGWRNAQNDGISQQFTFTMPVNADSGAVRKPADYAYSVDASQDGWWSGMWGLMRVYNLSQRGPRGAPSETRCRSASPTPMSLTVPARSTAPGSRVLRPDGRTGQRRAAAMTVDELTNRRTREPGMTTCRATRPTIMSAVRSIPNGGTLVYNPRGTGEPAQFQGPLHDPTAHAATCTPRTWCR